MHRDKWKDKAACYEYDTNIFFDKYEEEEALRPAVDKLCSTCSVAKTCFAVGVSTKEWGVWGGIYLEGGQISKEFNSHRTSNDWGETWKYLTM
jgi:hypothetical protein